MTPELFERLLYSPESDSLDFKESQYPPLSSPELAKQELLKDVLAFANSWRSGDGYILRGVKEVMGGKAEVVGVTEHFDDADLQEFANKKTNKPINFSYQVFPFGGVQVGVLTFRTQVRPIYLRNDFGSLRRNAVYVRRGSSTAEASPEEVADMTKASVAAEPVLEVQFYDDYAHEPMGDSIIVNPLNRKPLDTHFLEPPRVSGLLAGIPAMDMVEAFGRPPKKIAQQYLLANSLLVQAPLSVTNHSTTTANGVRFEAKIKLHEHIIVRDDEFRPDSPFNAIHRPSETDVHVKEIDDGWMIRGGFGKVQPGATVACQPIYIGSQVACEVAVDLRLFSDELAPLSVKLRIKLEPEPGSPITIEELEQN